MKAVTLRGLLRRKLRASLTACGVVLGVAMISGTFVLTDTITSSFHQIFDAAYLHADAVVVAKAPFGVVGVTKETVSTTLLQRIRALPQVERAHGYIDAHGQLIDPQGRVVGSGTDETLAFGIPTNQLDAMNPLTLVSGTWPYGPHDVIIDESTARSQHLGVGTTVGIVARKPLEHFRVVGVFRFGGVSSLGPTHMFALNLGVAQRIFDKQGMVDEIDVARRQGVTTAGLLRAIRNVLPPTARATSATQQAADATSQVAQQFVVLEYVLLVFGAVALLVAAFVIFNTLSITVAQRVGELGTLRALGASRVQILRSIMLEGAVIGVAGSVVGLGAGIGFAKGLYALFSGSGIHLPTAGLVFSGRTVLIGLGAGIVFTLAASAWPAGRARRISPILAMRQDAAVPTDHMMRRGKAVTLGSVGLSVGALVLAALFSGLSTSFRLVAVAAGALLLFVALAAAAGWTIPALAVAIEKPLELFGRTTARLARDNTVRAPGRTSTTAAALTVGITLIVMATTLAKGLSQATGDSLRRQITADYVVSPKRDVLPPEVQRRLSAAGIVNTGIRAGTVHTFDSNEVVTAVDPATIRSFYHLHGLDGTDANALTQLNGTGALVASDFAAAHHLHSGMALTAQRTSGVTLHLVIRGVYASPTFSPVLGAMTITTHLFDRSFTTPGDREIYVKGGPSTTGRAAIMHALTPFPTARLQSFDEFTATGEAAISQVLNLFYLLLALSIVISLFGIVNTLALSVTERTREIGLLRAIGMTRQQVARMIRAESVIIALIGVITGIATGLALAGAATAVVGAWSIALSIPWITLAVLVLVAILAGIVAGVFPARRAARLDPLTALSYE